MNANVSAAVALCLLLSAAGLSCKGRKDSNRKLPLEELDDVARRTGQALTPFEIAHGGPTRAKRLREVGNDLDDRGLCTNAGIRDAQDADENYEACAIALGVDYSGSNLNEFRKTFPTAEAVKDVCRRMDENDRNLRNPDSSLARWALVPRHVFCDTPVQNLAGVQLTGQQVAAQEAQARAERMARRRAERERKVN